MLVLALFTLLIKVNEVYAVDTINGQSQNFYCEILGDGLKFDIQIAKIVKYVILIIQIAAPLILVVVGMIDLVKAMASQKEDEIKKGQQILIKRLITAVLIFFVFAVVKFIISLVASDRGGGIMNCVDCFINGPENGQTSC